MLRKRQLDCFCLSGPIEAVVAPDLVQRANEGLRGLSAARLTSFRAHSCLSVAIALLRWACIA